MTDVNHIYQGMISLIEELKSLNYRLERAVDRIGPRTDTLMGKAPTAAPPAQPSNINFVDDVLQAGEEINSMVSYIRGNVVRLEHFTLTNSDPTSLTPTQAGRGY